MRNHVQFLKILPLWAVFISFDVSASFTKIPTFLGLKAKVSNSTLVQQVQHLFRGTDSIDTQYIRQATVGDDDTTTSFISGATGEGYIQPPKILRPGNDFVDVRNLNYQQMEAFSNTGDHAINADDLMVSLLLSDSPEILCM